MNQSALPENRPKGKHGCLLSAVLTAALLVAIGFSVKELLLPRLPIVMEHGDEIPQELLDLAERNPEAADFVRSYPKEHEAPHDPSLSAAERKADVPLLLQWDKRWGYLPYGGQVAGLTACGPMCLAMAGYAVTEDEETFRPDKVLEFARKGLYYVPGTGSSWTLISEGGPELGLTVRELPLDCGTMENSLQAGNPIICAMGPGAFTTTGHFIVLTGVEDGKFSVNDPNSREKSEKLWEYAEFSDQIRNLWEISA